MKLTLRAAEAARIAPSHASPAVALTVAVAAIAIVAYRAWWSLVFVAFAVAMVVVERRGASHREACPLAIALGGSAGLSLLGLGLVSVSEVVDDIACRDPCASLAPTVLLAGIAAGTAGAIGLTGCLRYLRRPQRWPLVLPAVNLLLLGLFAVALISGARSGNAVVEIGALTAATGAIPLALDRPRLLRAAVVAQVADLGTFGFAWQLGAGELNPVGRWMMEALFGPPSAYGSWPWEGAAVTGVILILAKLTLIGFLIWVTPLLGRYRRIVLGAATVAGGVGAATNLF